MSAYPPLDFNVPLDLDAVQSGEFIRLGKYFREFHNALNDNHVKVINSIFGITEDFQPTINNAGKTASIAAADYDSRTATYKRIGNLVWITMSVHWEGADVTGTGDLIIQELPFTAKKRSLFTVFDDDNATDPAGVCQVAAGDKDLTTFTIGSASLAQIEGDHELVITGVYLVES